MQVIRVEMQSMKKDPNKPVKLGVWGTAKYVYREAGFKGLYRGVTPRIALGVWQTICMVALGDVAKVFILFSSPYQLGIHCQLDRGEAYRPLNNGSDLESCLELALRVVNLFELLCTTK
jgi:hypothetical protein